MLCPNDKQTLETATGENYQHIHCLNCEGVWLTEEYMAKLTFDTKFNMHSYNKEMRKKARTKTSLPCPQACGSLYSAELDLLGFEIDWCDKCKGSWLDKGELDKLLTKYPEVREIDPDESFLAFILEMAFEDLLNGIFR